MEVPCLRTRETASASCNGTLALDNKKPQDSSIAVRRTSAAFRFSLVLLPYNALQAEVLWATGCPEPKAQTNFAGPKPPNHMP